MLRQVEVEFRVVVDTDPVEVVAVCGPHPTLGAGDITQAPRLLLLQSRPCCVWGGKVAVPFGSIVSYYYVVVGARPGTSPFESGPHRQLQAMYDCPPPRQEFWVG
jgi:hypothetical protein